MRASHVPDGQQARAVGQVGCNRNFVDKRCTIPFVLRMGVLPSQIVQHHLPLAARLRLVLSVKRDRAAVHRARRPIHFGISRCDGFIRRIILHIGCKRQIIGQAVPLDDFFARHRGASLPVLAKLCLERCGRLGVQPHHRAAIGRIVRITRQRVL